MSNCVLKPAGQSKGLYFYVCDVCGQPWESRLAEPKKIHHGPCPAKPHAPPPPRLIRKLANFSLASIQHAMSGFPTCSQEEIDARIAVCHGCELYQPRPDNPEIGVCLHPDCGCTVTREGKFVSKLAWRDQKCPLEKWSELT